MLPKHYQGFKRAFPDLTDSDCLALFEAGLYTPGDVKKASREDLEKVLSKSKVGKIQTKVKKLLGG